jgi:hypothetical protein
VVVNHEHANSLSLGRHRTTQSPEEPRHG